MMLDALTPKGLEAIEQSRHGLELIPRKFVETAQDKAGDIDGFFLNADGTAIAAAVEIKSRNLSVEELNAYGNEWLITFEKVHKGAHIAKSLCVPFFGLLYLIKDRKAYLIKLADEHGNIVAPMKLDVTETQATCNGGHARRTNAYICMKNAVIYG